MWKLMVALCFVAFGAAAEQQKVLLAGRTYLIDLPANPNGALIVALHNASGNPEEFRLKTQLSTQALAKGYAVAYPLGTGFSWNAFYCCGIAQQKNSADIRFLDLVISDATARFGLSAKRIYLTGMGNGSVMAETYAARRASSIKAVAGVAGTIHLGRTPATSVPMLHIHGLADTVVPYGLNGPENGSKRKKNPFTPVLVQIKAFVGVHGQLKKTSRVIDAKSDGTSVAEDNYRDAAGRTQVRLMTIVGGRHVWPGSERKGEGNTQEIGATKEVLRFFAEHP